MKKRKSGKKQKVKVQTARNAAWDILAHRRRLAVLMSRGSCVEDLSYEDQKEARKILNIIEQKKRAIANRKFDVTQVLTWAANNPKSKVKKVERIERQLKPFKKSARNSGVGVYQMGGSLKTWND